MTDELDAMVNAAEGSPDQPTPKKKGGRKKAEGEPKEKKVKEPKPKRDNIARVAGMTKIEEVRKALQIAIAKKAKANGKADAQARYDTEIEAAKAKLAELLESAKTTQDLLDLGEEPNRVITHFISETETGFEAWLNENGFKVSKKTLKSVTDDIPDGFFKVLPVSLHDTLVSRHTKSDYRLRAVCKAENFKAKVAAGDFVWDNKWINKAEPAAPVEE